jgi:hypothetical protein
VNRPGLWLWLAVVLGLYGGYQAWTSRAVSHPPGILVAAEPAQTPVGANPPRFRRHDAEIVAVARFEMEARVLGVERYRIDRMANLVPMDFAFGWGPMSDSKVLSRISISQSDRFYFWSTEDFPIPRRDIETHSANMHLIPANDSIERRIKAARVGQVVTLAGYLVNVKTGVGWTINSSLTRDDTGAGACEVIWVESFD